MALRRSSEIVALAIWRLAMVKTWTLRLPGHDILTHGVLGGEARGALIAQNNVWQAAIPVETWGNTAAPIASCAATPGSGSQGHPFAAAPAAMAPLSAPWPAGRAGLLDAFHRENMISLQGGDSRSAAEQAVATVWQQRNVETTLRAATWPPLACSRLCADDLYR
jgi:hypothetical protein